MEEAFLLFTCEIRAAHMISRCLLVRFARLLVSFAGLLVSLEHLLVNSCYLLVSSYCTHDFALVYS
ncbi:hypothetical protein ABIE66_004196 [Peribacillus sp. B2I2]|uniref:hypothetical protein n=1 Tax=Peribacillus sp. B2I2 TaxID=3156468 RepID=UPI003513685A